MGRFSSMINGALDTKNIDKLITGSAAKYLNDGDHVVTIVAVDCSMVSENRIKLVFENAEGKQHQETVFLCSYGNKSEFSREISNLWSALFADLNAVSSFLKELDKNDRAFELWVSMKLQITLRPSKGWVMKTDIAGKFGAYDSITGALLIGPYDTQEEVKVAAGAANQRRSFRKVFGATAVAAEENREKLLHAIKAAKSPTEDGHGFSASPNLSLASNGGIF